MKDSARYAKIVEWSDEDQLTSDAVCDANRMGREKPLNYAVAVGHRILPHEMNRRRCR